MITDEAYRVLEEALGPDNVSREQAVLDGYSWQPTLNDDPINFITRPEAVVLPSSTEEVQGVVRSATNTVLNSRHFQPDGARMRVPARRV